MATNYANALKLTVAKKWLSVKQLGFVNTILQGSRVTSQIPIIQPNKDLSHEWYEKKQKATSVLQPRVLNQNPDPKAVNQYEHVVTRTIQIGTAVEVDYKTLTVNPGLLDQMINDALYDLGFSLDFRFFNGDPYTNGDVDVVGLKALCTGEQLINNGGALNINASNANFYTFLSMLRQAKRRVILGPGQTLVGFTNEALYEAIIDARAKLGAAAIGSKYTDLLQNEAIEIEGVPITFVRTDDKGSDILPQTESSTSGSLYLVGIGGEPAEGSTRPNGIYGLSEGGVIMTPERIGNIRRVTMDYQIGYAIPTRSCARINLLQKT